MMADSVREWFLEMIKSPFCQAAVTSGKREAQIFLTLSEIHEPLKSRVLRQANSLPVADVYNVIE